MTDYSGSLPPSERLFSVAPLSAVRPACASLAMFPTFVRRTPADAPLQHWTFPSVVVVARGNLLVALASQPDTQPNMVVLETDLFTFYDQHKSAYSSTAQGSHPEHAAGDAGDAVFKTFKGGVSALLTPSRVVSVLRLFGAANQDIYGVVRENGVMTCLLLNTLDYSWSSHAPAMAITPGSHLFKVSDVLWHPSSRTLVWVERHDYDQHHKRPAVVKVCLRNLEAPSGRADNESWDLSAACGPQRVIFTDVPADLGVSLHTRDQGSLNSAADTSGRPSWQRRPQPLHSGFFMTIRALPGHPKLQPGLLPLALFWSTSSLQLRAFSLSMGPLRLQAKMSRMTRRSDAIPCYSYGAVRNAVLSTAASQLDTRGRAVHDTSDVIAVIENPRFPAQTTGLHLLRASGRVEVISPACNKASTVWTLPALPEAQFGQVSAFFLLENIVAIAVDGMDAVTYLVSKSHRPLPFALPRSANVKHWHVAANVSAAAQTGMSFSRDGSPLGIMQVVPAPVELQAASIAKASSWLIAARICNSWHRPLLAAALAVRHCSEPPSADWAAASPTAEMPASEIDEVLQLIRPAAQNPAILVALLGQIPSASPRLRQLIKEHFEIVSANFGGKDIDWHAFVAANTPLTKETNPLLQRYMQASQQLQNAIDSIQDSIQQSDDSVNVHRQQEPSSSPADELGRLHSLLAMIGLTLEVSSGTPRLRPRKGGLNGREIDTGGQHPPTSLPTSPELNGHSSADPDDGEQVADEPGREPQRFVSRAPSANDPELDNEDGRALLTASSAIRASRWLQPERYLQPEDRPSAEPERAPLFEEICRRLFVDYPMLLPDFVRLSATIMRSSSKQNREALTIGLTERALACLPPFFSAEETPISENACRACVDLMEMRSTDLVCIRQALELFLHAGHAAAAVHYFCNLPPSQRKQLLPLLLRELARQSLLGQYLSTVCQSVAEHVRPMTLISTLQTVLDCETEPQGHPFESKGQGHSLRVGDLPQALLRGSMQNTQHDEE